VERFKAGSHQGLTAREHADKIHDRYVRSGSEFDVNIIVSIKRACADMLAGKLPFPDDDVLHVFDVAQDAVKDLMEKDSYPRFVKSPLWTHYVDGTERRITGDKSHGGHATRHRAETVDGQVSTEEALMQRSYLKRAAANSASTVAHLRSSVYDHLDLGLAESLTRELAKYGKEHVVLSDFVDKVNNKGKTQMRIILLTNAAWYNVTPKTYEIKRRVPYSEITGVSYTLLPDDDFIYVELETGNDYLIACRNKVELITELAEIYR
jgi:hypothetical protein